MIVGNNTRIDKCRHEFRNHGYVGDVLVKIVSHCVICGTEVTEVLPRCYQSYCATEDAPSRAKYKKRLAQEGLKEPITKHFF